MLPFLIPIVILLISLIVIIVIFLKHFPQAAAIDLESLPAEQEAAMKAALMERRLKRRIMGIKNRLLPIVRKMGQGTAAAWNNLYNRLVQLEQRYRKKTETMSAEQQKEIKQKIRQLLDQAKEYIQEENLPEAEAKYIEVLSWDHKNLDAYFGLAEVYFMRREFAQARETFFYLLKLITSQKSGEEKLSKFSTPLTDAQISEARFDYAQCLQALDEFEEAKKQLDLLVEQEQKNPKFLDKSFELSILLKDREEARKAFEALKGVNPDNQKLPALEEQLKALS